MKITSLTLATLLCGLLCLTACEETDADRQIRKEQQEYEAATAKAEAAKRPQAVVLERHAENLGGAVFRYSVKVKVTVPTYSSTFLITCTYDENNIRAGDCGQWPLPDHFDWSIHTCEWEIYDPLTGKSEHETCVLGLGMSGYMHSGSWIVKPLDNEPNQ